MSKIQHSVQVEALHVSCLVWMHGCTLLQNSFRFVCDCLREHYPDDVEVRVQYFGDLVKLDESCCEVLELIQLSLSAGVHSVCMYVYVNLHVGE